MSIFNFIKDAGKACGDSAGKVSAEVLKKELDSHGLGTDGVQVSVQDDKVVLEGAVKDQSIFEKALLAVGNVTGVSEVRADGLKVAGASAGQTAFYTVKAGDPLWKIAEASYGKGKGDKHTTIFEANKPMLSHPDKIYPGQVLRIPALA